MLSPMRLLCAFLLCLAASASAGEYRIVADDSSVIFRVRHMAGFVTGRFERFSGGFAFEPGKPEVWRATATIEVASLNTTGRRRDDHLLNADFFDSKRCPKVSFVSRKALPSEGGRFKLEGDLTLRCVTRPVTLDLAVGDTGLDERGRWQALRATTTIDRRLFGMTWAKPGSPLFVGDEVIVELDVQGMDALAKAKK
jgi:polyisoprenoid-binding protein YceI